jgi:ElaA protein
VRSDPITATVHRTWAVDLEPWTLYEMLRLRVDVFVVEQGCPYPELDGRDLEPRTRHYWLGGDGRPEPVLGCVRLLKEATGEYRIGRLCVGRDFRGRGLGRRLMDGVLAEARNGTCLLDAQQDIAGFYIGYGFEAVGEPYDWAGVRHIPMQRPANAT